MLPLLTLALCVLQTPPPPEAVELAGPEIRYADLAGLTGFEAAARTGGARTLARLPVGRREMTLERTALAGLVRRALPGAAVAGGEGIVRFRRAERQAEAGGPCYETVRAIAPDEIVTAEDFAAAACARGLAEGRLARGAGGKLRAAEPLGAGRYVGRLSLPPAPDVAEGQGLTLVATAGPVRIERPVVALQPGRGGGRVFVRDEEGQVLSVPVARNKDEAR